MKKKQTYDQVEATKAKAARFASDVLQDDDLASDLEDESPESYAERKHIKITNPLERRTTEVANGNGNGDNLTKSDLQDICDELESILTDYQPESTREDLAGAIGDALDVLQGNAPPDEGDEDDTDDGDGN